MAVDNCTTDVKTSSCRTLRCSDTLTVTDSFGHDHKGIIIDKFGEGDSGFWFIMWRIGNLLLSWMAPVSKTSVVQHDDGSFELSHGRITFTVSGLPAADIAA